MSSRMNKPTLLVCSSGGHLAQLHALAPRLDIVDEERLWITFDTPQARSLLRDENHLFVRYTRPRDLMGVARNFGVAAGLLTGTEFGAVVSTGAAVAVSFLPLAAALGHDAVYIESATRTTGPSLTGRILERAPGVSLFTQYERWADVRWRYLGSIFDGFAGAATRPPELTVRKVVVSLGTIQGFGFRRLIDRVLSILPPRCDVVWQVGDTDVTGLDIAAVRALPAHDLAAAIRDADVVISHAGTGSALMALEAGKCPILVPRRAVQQEHVDDHQLAIAEELGARGLAISRQVEALTVGDLDRSRRIAIVRVGGPRMLTGLAGPDRSEDRVADCQAPFPAS
jgi:UDP-N-acetylglucosamine--N-acetylmuramyl-(pentapeptide) pyrophosphoryl-undecaprenol N-acetylglucosamine transferase